MNYARLSEIIESKKVMKRIVDGRPEGVPEGKALDAFCKFVAYESKTALATLRQDCKKYIEDREKALKEYEKAIEVYSYSMHTSDDLKKLYKAMFKLDATYK